MNIMQTIPKGFEFLKSRADSGGGTLKRSAKHCAIGLDMEDNVLKMVQVESSDKGISLVAGGHESLPAYVKPDTVEWQKWAIEAIKGIMSKAKFRGKDVVAAMPAGEMFIEHVKLPAGGNTEGENTADDTAEQLPESVLAKIKQKMPFEISDAIIKCMPTEQDNGIVVAVEREKINRHLAIFEKAGVHIRSMGIWPVALKKIYTSLFGRRKDDRSVVIQLVDVKADCTNVAICRHENLLFAHSLAIGANQLELGKDETTTKLAGELSGCCRQLAAMQRDCQVERLIFLSGPTVDRRIYTSVAKQLEIPSQMGDILKALQWSLPWDQVGIDRRACKVNWAAACGLSLS
ncbi:MAG TPA: pilus assembly protein PilM [Sedimentisphaerales bacterium]|nr:pilus assembly protein PilM [Sedimentisphaerales bacterium]